jgi:hypothetical protein
MLFFILSCSYFIGNCRHTGADHSHFAIGGSLLCFSALASENWNLILHKQRVFTQNPVLYINLISKRYSSDNRHSKNFFKILKISNLPINFGEFAAK